MRNVLLAVLLSATPVAAEPTLVGYARLDAHTFRDGPTIPTSGQFIEQKEHNGVMPPFVDKQPVQGISSLVPMPDKPGSYWALSDNGFGSKANSADYVLCVYEVTPNFETGEVAWSVAFELSDPNDVITWPTVADGETYPNSDIPVPASIRDGRLLTGADFDIESLVRMPDGTFWIGDEFGPFLLHFDAEGRLLKSPVGLPGEGMHSPDHPTKDPAKAKIGRSAGFEGMAAATWVTGEEEASGFMAPAGTEITIKYAILEKTIEDDASLRVFFHDDFITPLAFDGQPQFIIKRSMPDEAEAIGEMIFLSAPVDQEEPALLVTIERDGQQGGAAKIKRLAIDAFENFLILEDGDIERPAMIYVDLLDLADPDDLDSDGSNRFRFPYLTIESVAVVDERTVIVCNDNNFPFTNGRPEQAGPDATEFILIRFDKPLAELASDAE